MKSLPARSVTAQSIPGGWSERAFLLGDRRLCILLPAQPDEFLEQLEQTAVTARETDPYWAELWPASLSMARIVRASHWPKQARAIELGCGVGVVGLAALLAGLDVAFTDHVELAVATAVENAHRNGFTNAQGCVLDWAQPPREQYPIILASDVLYDRELHAPLLHAIEALLADGGECWLGDPGRSAAEVFLQQARLTGWKLRMLDEEGRDAARLKLGEFRLLVLRRVSNVGSVEHQD
ncbi:MAG: methyltransferase domain-containing protein [Planctomycetota bacterium]|nr:methyltransferase domain-containing protein [Planctomycetota bacterium]